MNIKLGKYRKNRKIDIKIDNYDIWNLDHTLALIIYPCLVKIKEAKAGSGFVDDEDVPEELRSYNAPPKKYDYENDDNFHKRFQYILEEMSWAFGEYINDERESQFYSGKSDMVFVPIDKDGNTVDKKDAVLYKWENGPNDTFSVDNDKKAVYEDRISNGIRLFGKYFQTLWT